MGESPDAGQGPAIPGVTKGEIASGQGKWTPCLSGIFKLR